MERAIPQLTTSWLAALGLAAAASGCDGCKDQRVPVNASGAAVLKSMAHACAHRQDVAFIVASDTHFGFDEATDKRNEVAIEAMNGIAGTPWPKELGGQVGEPCGVLVTGDLTENGKPEEWTKFVAAFGLRGQDAALHYPVFETLGNHDKNYGTYVRDRIYERHGSTVYSFDWGPLHLVSLGEAPDDSDLKWLEEDLAKVPEDRYIVPYFHFPLAGPYSTGQWFGDGPYRDRLEAVLEHKRVAGVFHGHYHATGLYEWRDRKVYRTGSPKHSWHTFTVAEVNDGAIKVASWNYDDKVWVWWEGRRLDGAGAETRFVDPRVPE